MSEGWMEPQSWPELAEGEVHVWLARLPSARGEINHLVTLLTPEELERAARFRTEELRERWSLTRAFLRSLLARYVRVSARKITFQLGAHGKPALAGASELHFNTSHSGDFAAFAFTRAGDIGVDIEQMRDDRPLRDGIAERFFAPSECAQLNSTPEPERVRAFFKLWTRKEAFVKARGDGLASGLDQFEVSLTEPRVLNVTGGDATEWWMIDLPGIDSYSGAVVVKASACRARFWKWSAATRSDDSPAPNSPLRPPSPLL